MVALYNGVALGTVSGVVPSLTLLRIQFFCGSVLVIGNRFPAAARMILI